jgi:hypothetical protein
MPVLPLEKAVPDPSSRESLIGPGTQASLIGVSRPTTNRPTARDRADRTVRDAPTAIGAVRVNHELGGSKLERVRRADRRAKATEDACVRVDDDHDATSSLGLRPILVVARGTLSVPPNPNRLVTSRVGELRDAGPGRGPRTR